MLGGVVLVGWSFESVDASPFSSCEAVGEGDLCGEGARELVLARAVSDMLVRRDGKGDVSISANPGGRASVGGEERSGAVKTGSAFVCARWVGGGIAWHTECRVGPQEFAVYQQILFEAGAMFGK